MIIEGFYQSFTHWPETRFSSQVKRLRVATRASQRELSASNKIHQVIATVCSAVRGLSFQVVRLRLYIYIYINIPTIHSKLNMTLLQKEDV